MGSTQVISVISVISVICGGRLRGQPVCSGQRSPCSRSHNQVARTEPHTAKRSKTAAMTPTEAPATKASARRTRAATTGTTKTGGTKTAATKTPATETRVGTTRKRAAGAAKDVVPMRDVAAREASEATRPVPETFEATEATTAPPLSETFEATEATTPPVSETFEATPPGPATAPPPSHDAPTVAGEEWTPEELAAVRAELEALVAQYLQEIEQAESAMADVQREGGEGAGDDTADAGTKTFEREQEISLANNRRDLLNQVEHALIRLDEGRYGRCESCGGPVGKLRLQAFPSATLCRECKQREERR